MSAAFRLSGASEADVALLWDYGCQGTLQEGEDTVAYFAAELELPLAGQWEQVTDKDYLASYYADLTPIYLKHLVVAPTHTSVTLRAGQKPLWLDPGMAFGSGHHETTRMALEALESQPLSGKTVLDVGAGSGILAIAATLLGAANVSGIDIDPLTLPVAQANATLNRAAATFEEATLDKLYDGSADVIAANLYAELHMLLAPDYARVLRSNGVLIITGILNERLAGVREAVNALFTETSLRQEHEWSLLVLRRK